ncbi:MAG: MATE family efflux transporter, partial [Pseudomonadales bacterium]|nr:MATE family efflux transporter [Pseudomonadales bacterium]
VTAMLMSVGIAVAGSPVIALLTNVEAVRASAATFLPWAVAAPVVSVWCYLLDGIFIGATRTAEMRNAMIASLLAFLGAWWWLADAFGNHGLWLALLFYFIARAASLAWYLPSVRAAVVTTR